MKYQFVKTFILTIITALFVTMSARSQNLKNYTAEWNKVDAFIKKSLPQSALTEVKKIYVLAKKENQDAQVIKALVMMSTLQDEIREENDPLSISEIEKEIPTAKEPARSILYSLLAGMYYDYYQQVRWQLYDRTKTTDFKKEDINTWDADDFHKKIGDLYLQSIKEEKLLQQTKLDAYGAIITKGNMRHLRPTLYDLLAHRALSYFENDERDVSNPAYAFEIDAASAFDPAADFITRKFPTRDELSLHHKALLSYQKLIAFHLKDAKPDALIDADLARLEFVRSKSVHPDKQQLYFNAINHIANQYGNAPAAAQAWYLLAEFHETNASTYKPYGDTTYRFSRIKAREICEKVLLQKDSSEGRTNCYNLLQRLKAPDMQVSIEKVNVPDQPFRVLMGYRNFTTIYMRVVKPDAKLKAQMEERYGDKYWNALLSAPVVKSWEQALPATNDMQWHNAEIKVDALPIGEYIILASTQKDFNEKRSMLGARFFYVSNISYIHSGTDYVVLNRESGQPLANASVQVWENKYDYSASKNIKQKEKLYKTNENGFFQRERKLVNNNYSTGNFALDITHGDDRLFMNDWIYDYYYNNKENAIKYTINTFLFTDRAIYRPGQTLFFKGIVLQKQEDDRSTAVTNYHGRVQLVNANGEVVDTIEVSTNEFGSFNGKFQLPQTGLTGSFSISSLSGTTSNGYAGFRVEEYKRPKFFVQYEPIKGTYKVNDKIKVTGTAKAYAGNNIDGASVKYRVVREARWMYPWMSWRWWYPSEPQEIAHGELKTDKDGKFIVEFTAMPDLKMDKKNDPVFTYTIYADVTDINGETRSGEESIDVSYKALKIVASIPDRLPADSLGSLSIFTQNMGGQFEPATINVKISRLNEEKRLIRPRYWDRPDQFVMSKEEYIRHFPHDEYDNESDMKSWPKGEKQFDKTDSTNKEGKWKLNGSSFKPGFYMIEIETKDKYGETVKDVRFIELFDEKSRTLNRPMYSWLNYKKQPKEPGENASYDFGTSADNVFLVQQVNRGAFTNKDIKPDYTFLKTGNQITQLDFPTWPRQNFDIHWVFVKHNRVFTEQGTVYVPRNDEMLNIEYATYRDKTEPGAVEKWKLKISGYKNEKVAAEVLASMYDASLDQFAPHAWQSLSRGYAHYYVPFSYDDNFKVEVAEKKYIETASYKELDKRYDYLFFDGDHYGNVYYNNGRGRRMLMSRAVMAESAPSGAMDMAKPVAQKAPAPPKKDGGERDEKFKSTDDRNELGGQPKTGKNDNATGDVQIRKNFNETAFFFPDLRTDADGNIEFTFTMPEALTKWKFMSLAHTKNGANAQSTKEIITQKDLMVQPNAPRFLREGDKMEFSAKIVNLTGKELTGQAELQLLDATTNQPIDGWFKNIMPKQFFTVAAGQSEAVKFPIEVPYLFNKALVWRIVAKAGNFSDGEENAMPVLTNRMLVTETLPLPMRGAGSKTFTFDKLLNSGKSESLQHYAVTLEYTSNPAWYAVQSLPYLMEYPYECAEQTWNRYYANTLATFIANSSPRIKEIFEKWKTLDTAALMSNLQKNQELKALLLEETPWVMQAKSEAEQKKNIAMLFDMVKMSQQLTNSYEKLKQMQSSNGGFVWFSGGPDDRYITQYIVTGIGHLKKIKAIPMMQDARIASILQTAIPYLDRKIKEDYDDLIKYKADLKKYVPGYTTIQYLYMRSFFPEHNIAEASKKAYTYFRERVQQTWTQQSKYMQGMTALALYRTADAKTPADILRSLKETSINNEELGMYWKDLSRGWFWYDAPIERHALLIEAFQEAGKDTKAVDDLRTWLLKNKQTNNWGTTKATAEACYALLLQGTNWITNEPVVEIKLGSTNIKSTDSKQEAGTGYFKKVIDAAMVKPEMGNITVTVNPVTNSNGQNTNSATWGSVYWQYFEDLDKITTASTPLKLVKKLFIEKNTDRGPVLTPVNDGDVLKVGNKIKVRIELRVDRDMEYVHMKDMRASSLEPVNVLSSYKYQGGLGYYESTRDASTNFFFSSLRKGTYVFEYPLFVTHAGNFSNGITTIQCMYAPEFTSHSEGIRIRVE